MPRFITRIQYDTLLKLPKISCPVLVAHSREDGLIPFWMGEKLNQVAGGEWVELNGAHSDNPFEKTLKYSEKVQAFVRTCALSRSAANNSV